MSTSRAQLIAAVLIHAAATGMLVHGELLPVVNPSFEDLSRPLLIGEQTNGAGGDAVPVATRFPFGGGGVDWSNPVFVSGWRTFLPPPGDLAVNYAGALNPPLLGGEPFVVGHDGQYVAAVQAARMGQALNVLLRANTRYRLSFLGGIGRFGTPYILSAGLIAVDDPAALPLMGQPGVIMLALSSGATPPPESFGTMLPYVVECITPRTLPPNLEGRCIGIHMFGSDGIPRVPYDDFRLEALSATCPYDINDDDSVDLADLAGLLGNFGMQSGAIHQSGDLDGDQDVDVADLALLVHFGDVCS